MIDEQTQELLQDKDKAEQASIAKSQLLATMNSVNWQRGMVENHFSSSKVTICHSPLFNLARD